MSDSSNRLQSKLLHSDPYFSTSIHSSSLCMKQGCLGSFMCKFCRIKLSNIQRKETGLRTSNITKGVHDSYIARKIKPKESLYADRKFEKGWITEPISKKYTSSEESKNRNFNKISSKLAEISSYDQVSFLQKSCDIKTSSSVSYLLEKRVSKSEKTEKNSFCTKTSLSSNRLSDKKKKIQKRKSQQLFDLVSFEAYLVNDETFFANLENKLDLDNEHRMKLMPKAEKIQLESVIDGFDRNHLKMAENEQIVTDLNQPPLKKKRTQKNIENSKRRSSKKTKNDILQRRKNNKIKTGYNEKDRKLNFTSEVLTQAQQFSYDAADKAPGNIRINNQPDNLSSNMGVETILNNFKQSYGYNFNYPSSHNINGNRYIHAQPSILRTDNFSDMSSIYNSYSCMNTNYQHQYHNVPNFTITSSYSNPRSFIPAIETSSFYLHNLTAGNETSFTQSGNYSRTMNNLEFQIA